jgi:hypothetical protein
MILDVIILTRVEGKKTILTWMLRAFRLYKRQATVTQEDTLITIYWDEEWYYLGNLHMHQVEFDGAVIFLLQDWCLASNTMQGNIWSVMDLSTLYSSALWLITEDSVSSSQILFYATGHTNAKARDQGGLWHAAARHTDTHA